MLVMVKEWGQPNLSNGNTNTLLLYRQVTKGEAFIYLFLKMPFSSMVKHIAEHKAEKSPIGTEPALKVGTYWVSTKPTDSAPQVGTTWDDEKMWLWGSCWQVHIHNLFLLNLVCASGTHLCMYFYCGSLAFLKEVKTVYGPEPPVG